MHNKVPKASALGDAWFTVYGIQKRHLSPNSFRHWAMPQN